MGDSSQNNEEDIIEELEDRERRAANLILYNLDEHVGSSVTDADRVRDVLKDILPNDTSITKTFRLGKKQQNKSRPLRVSFPNKDVVVKILRGKSQYLGPVKITQDRIPKQRKHFKDLQAQLRMLNDAGDINKTIRYRNGVPKIISINSHVTPKN